MVDAERLLERRRVLVVEDEYLLATELASMLIENGAKVLGPLPTIARARRMLNTVIKPDAAVLDVNLGGEMVWRLAELLVQQGVPIVLTTGYDADVIPAPFALLPRCEKPTSPDEILAAVQRVLIEPSWQPSVSSSVGLGRSAP